MRKVGESEVVMLHQLHDFIINRNVGAIFVYVRGYIARELPRARRWAADGVGEYSAVVKEAWRLHEEGRVHLTQRRLSFGRYEYRVHKRR